MNMRRTVVCLVILLMTSFHFSRGARNSSMQQVEVRIDTGRHGEGLPYTGAPLGWADFKAAPDSSSHFSAMIYCGIAMRHELVQKDGINIMSVRIRPYMNHTRSWYKDSLANETLLVHEQGHFAIAALVARELAEEVSRTFFEVTTFKPEIDALYQRYQAILAERQTEYDEATHHGVKAEEQVAWNDQLGQSLQTVAVH